MAKLHEFSNSDSWLSPTDDERNQAMHEDDQMTVDVAAEEALDELELAPERGYWTYHDAQRAARLAARKALEHMTAPSRQGEQ